MTRPDDIQLDPLLSAEQIERRVGELAGEIAAVYGDAPVVLVPILSGSLIFVSDLVRKLPMDMVIELCGLSSYRDGETPGQLRWTLGPPRNLDGRHVLVVDDIVDTGATLGRVVDTIARQQPASVRTCTLLLRTGADRSDPVADTEVDFEGFRIGRGFVVGYGLDYDGRFRNRPGISVVRRDEDET